MHYLNGCHSNIKFTIESEQNNAIPFLDILITRNQNNTFMTSIYVYHCCLRLIFDKCA